VLFANENVVILFLTMFAIGIGVGSIMCSKLMKGLVHAKYVPIAAFGMTIFAYRLYAASSHSTVASDGTIMGMFLFLQQPVGRRILFDLFALAVCGGFYSVPLYTILQLRAEKTHGARAIACNNLMNSLFMVAASVFAICMLKLKFTIPHIFLAVAIMNTGAAVYICKLLPFSPVGAILKLIYRMEVKGGDRDEEVPKDTQCRIQSKRCNGGDPGE
jgi:acyl-[acyl-carrier-protein]-phospholipid O-acyltransferase / long-chain-fatty-acid--[acyl-carrier-protein] ligase